MSSASPTTMSTDIPGNISLIIKKIVTAAHVLIYLEMLHLDVSNTFTAGITDAFGVRAGIIDEIISFKLIKSNHILKQSPRKDHY